MRKDVYISLYFFLLINFEHKKSSFLSILGVILGIIFQKKFSKPFFESNSLFIKYLNFLLFSQMHQ